MSWWQYLMLVNIYLLLFYGFYVLLLSRETFFQLNRVYLVAASLLSFFIPLIQSNWVKNLFITQQVQHRIYSSPVLVYQFAPIRHTQFTVGSILAAVYLAGISLLAARLIFQLIILKKVIDRPQSSAAYSFFKKIKLGEDVEDNHVIAAHEKAHANQWHSVDILLIEAVMIINWFNPVVYLYRFAIKHIHEFIADRQALKSGTSKADYALLLLSKTFNAQAHQLVNPFFNNSLLKQRIVMLQKNNSRRMALIKYGLSAPLFVLMLVLSSATVTNSKTVNFINKKAQQVFLISADVNTISGLQPSGAAKRMGLVTVEDTSQKKEGKVFTAVEQVPEFPGGLMAFGQFLGRNIKYPADSRQKGIQGRVIITFIVEEDGALSNIAIARGLAQDIDKESLRVLNLSPKWSPGIQNGKAVRVAYSVPIAYTLDDDTKPVKASENKTASVVDKNYSVRPTKLMPFFSGKPDTTALGVTLDSNMPGSKKTPLYILDGRELKDLSSLSPEKIESINILKDKSAIAIYGAKGSSGVVLITSKKNLLLDTVKK